MKEAQIKISEYIQAYKDIFKQEYETFLKGQKVKASRRDESNKFSEWKGSDLEIRAMTEVPETLDTILRTRLLPEQFSWYDSKPGKRWLARTHKEFSITSHV